MATRTVTVRLRADITQYTRGMRTAAQNTSRLAGAGATVGTAMVAGFAIAAASAAKFDKALSNVRAVTGANTKQMGQLRAAALEAGKTTSYTATQAADAEAELARAGVSVADITGGALKGSLALAASGQMDLADSAVIAAQSMNTFGLKGKDVSHIADVMSAAANKSAADMHGLGMSMRMGGLLAHQTGLSLEETVGTLAAFADHALIGSDAGTSMKVMLQRLVPQSDEAQRAMDKIGFSAYDSTGKFVGLSELAGRMKTSFSKLTPEARNAAMATIFGADAVRSATILYELGSKGINKYVKSVDDQGAAGRMASIQTDNLIGDLERLRGAIEVALIEGGSAANGALRGMAQWITKVVNAYNSLPVPLQKAVTLITGVGGAALLAVSGFLLMLPRIQATRTALTQMGVTAARTRTAMLRMGQIGAVVAGLELVSFAAQKIKDQFADAPPSVSKMANSMVDLATKGKAGGEAARVFGANLDGFGKAVQRIAHPGGQNRATDIVNSITFGLTEGLAESDIALQDARDQVKSVDEALAGLVQGGAPDTAADAFHKLSLEAQAQGTSTEKLMTLLPGYSDALASTDTQSKLSAGSQAKLGEQAGLTADEMKDQRSEAEKLSDALKTLNGAAISAAEKEIGFRQSLADLSEAVKDNGRSLDVTSEKGRKVKSAFLDAAQAAMDHAQAVAEQTNSQAAGQKVLETDIGLLRKQMKAAHFSSDAIDALTSAFLKLPDSKTPTVDVKTQGAISGLEDVRKKLAATKGKKVTVDALTKDARAQLEALGFKIKNTKGKKLSVTAPTGSAKAAVDALKRAIDALKNKSVRLTTTQVFRTVQESHGSNQAAKNFAETREANGGILQFYADGGTRENHVAQIAPAGSWRVWGEPETEGEAYIPFAPSKRPRSRQIAAATVRRLGGAVKWFADGGFNYTPSGAPVLGGAGNAKERVDKLVGSLRDAWKEYNTAVSDLKKASAELTKVRKDKKSTKSERAAATRERDAASRRVKAERADIADINSALGQSKYAKAPVKFDLSNYMKQLNASAAATTKWRANLAKIAARGGQDVADLLESMGEEGYSLVNRLAGASKAHFTEIVADLQKVSGVAKATLADFNKQIAASTKESSQFATDLQKLASQGFGDLAQALAAQGDSSAMALAHQAAGSSKDASAANTAVKKNTKTLTGEDLTNSLVLLSTLRAKAGSGYAELLGAGLDMTTIKALVPRMMAQINALPDSYKAKFLQQVAGQSGGVAMARGGILNRSSLVLGGEAGVPESWIPHDGSARSRQLLAVTANRFGYGLIPASRYAYLSRSQAGAARQGDHNVSITLHGAKQTSGEQAMDIARHMQHIG